MFGRVILGSPLIMIIIGAGNAIVDDRQPGGDDDHHGLRGGFRDGMVC
jgi:hypothetical protein